MQADRDKGMGQSLVKLKLESERHRKKGYREGHCVDIELGFPPPKTNASPVTWTAGNRRDWSKQYSGSASLDWLPLGHFFQMEG